MAFNNIVPVWSLFPIRLRYNTNNWKGFNTREEAVWFIRMEGDHIHDYKIYDDNENSS